MYEALADQNLAGAMSSIEHQYDDLSMRVSAPWRWESVYKQALFVLQKYAKRAGATEKEAVEKLLWRLEALAKPGG
jgi:hypothetical protein